MHQPYCLFETYNISHEYYVAKVYFHKANKIIYGCFYPNIILFVTTCNKIGYIWSHCEKTEAIKLYPLEKKRNI